MGLDALLQGQATPWQWTVALFAATIACVTDLHSRRIPNILTFPLLISGLIAGYMIGGGAGLADSVLACLALALPFVVLFVVGGGGAGDAKFMAGIGAWLGIKSGLLVLVAVTLAGAMFASIVLVTAALQARRRTAQPSAQAPAEPIRKKQIPYGVAMCFGTWIAAIGWAIWLWQ